MHAFKQRIYRRIIIQIIDTETILVDQLKYRTEELTSVNSFIAAVLQKD